MNRILQPTTTRTVAGSIPIVIAFNHSMANGQHVSWPVHEDRAYSVPQPTVSSSALVYGLLHFGTPRSTSSDFVREIAALYAALLEGQEPLGAEFEAVWDANVAELYEA